MNKDDQENQPVQGLKIRDSDSELDNDEDGNPFGSDNGDFNDPEFDDDDDDEAPEALNKKSAQAMFEAEDR